MKVRACHLCSTCNFSPHWCTTHLLYSFSHLLPTFSQSSLELTNIHLYPAHQFTSHFCCSAKHCVCVCRFPTRLHVLPVTQHWVKHLEHQQLQGFLIDWKIIDINWQLCTAITRLWECLFNLQWMERRWTRGRDGKRMTSAQNQCPGITDKHPFWQRRGQHPGMGWDFIERVNVS